MYELDKIQVGDSVYQYSMDGKERNRRFQMRA
jgi:hypothetical protein